METKEHREIKGMVMVEIIIIIIKMAGYRAWTLTKAILKVVTTQNLYKLEVPEIIDKINPNLI